MKKDRVSPGLVYHKQGLGIHQCIKIRSQVTSFKRRQNTEDVPVELFCVLVYSVFVSPIYPLLGRFLIHMTTAWLYPGISETHILASIFLAEDGDRVEPPVSSERKLWKGRKFASRIVRPFLRGGI